ncbi:MAG TPA: 8-oxo-dGTP diphosphatase [Chthoniobacterales bacterium]
MDWNNWIPQQRATLCFIIVGTRVLLIHKLRGLGMGKVNAPGGKIDFGESPVDCAIRETQEEVGVTPLDPQHVAELSFHFTNGFQLQCSVFLAHGHVGEPHPTPEADPFWCELDSIPYHEMWQDDALWLPQVLAGEKIRGRFIFADEQMLGHELAPW